LGWEDTTTDESKVLVHISKIAGDDLRMAYGKHFLFEDVTVKRTDIYVLHVFLLAA
jgi:hypothetical protein